MECHQAILKVLDFLVRFKYKKHTIPQIVIGFIIGIILAYTTIFIYKKNVLKKLEEKKDDGCII